MNQEINERKKLNFNSIFNNNNSKFENNNSKLILICFTFVITIQLFIFVCFFMFAKIILKRMSTLGQVQEKTKNIKSNSFFVEEQEMFSENIIKKYENQQELFCQNQFLFNNALIDKSIKSAKIKFENISFNMLVYKTHDIVSSKIDINGFWEPKETRSVLSSLLYFSTKKNILKTDIIILDIGANIGWYSLFLGKKGYKIISFEPSSSNYYILIKNYCLNKEINVTIINSGLDKVSKNSSLYHPLHNIGNAYTFDENKTFIFKRYKKEEIKLSKLSDYLPYLNMQNLALIKLDVEGSEGKVIEGGIDLIIKYHIPFIFMEWTPDLMRLKGSDPKLFLELLENNGYKISKKDFLSKHYIPMDQLLNEKETNIYIVYIKFLE